MCRDVLCSGSSETSVAGAGECEAQYLESYYRNLYCGMRCQDRSLSMAKTLMLDTR